MFEKLDITFFYKKSLPANLILTFYYIPIKTPTKIIQFSNRHYHYLIKIFFYSQAPSSNRKTVNE